MDNNEQSGQNYEEPHPQWIELLYGPLHFRRHYDQGKLLEGQSDEQLLAYIHKPGGNIGDVADVTLDRRAASFRINWKFVDQRTGQRTRLKISYPISAIPKNPEQDIAIVTDAGLPLTEKLHVRNLYTKCRNAWNVMELEFRHAVKAGICNVYARRNAFDAPKFTKVPADIFLKFKITDWQLGEAEGPNGRKLFSIHLAPVLVSDEEVILERQVTNGSKESINVLKPKIKPKRKHFEDWFSARVKGWDKNEPFPSECDDWNAAKKAFPENKIPRALLRSAREKCTPFEWRKQGPKRRR